MNIALVCPYEYTTPSGVFEHTLTLGRELLKNNHKIILISPTSRLSTIGELNHFKIGSGIKIKTPNGSVAPIIWKIDKKKWRKILVENKIELVHFQEIVSNYTISLLPVVKKLKIKTVGTTNAFWPENLWFKNLMGRFLYRKLVSKFDVTTTISRACYESNPELLGKNFKVISPGYSPINLEKYDYPKFWNKNDINVLFVGRLEKRKGGIYLLSAIKKISELDLKKIVFHVVGEGNEYIKMLKMMMEIEELRVVFYGKVTNNFKFQLYKACDLYVAPATGGESFGINLLESLNARKLIIAGNNPGYKETLSDYPYKSFILDPKNSYELSKHLIEAIKIKPDDIYISWATDKVNRHAVENIVEEYLDCYRK